MLNALRITREPRAVLTLAEKLCREWQKVKRVINLTFVPRVPRTSRRMKLLLSLLSFLLFCCVVFWVK